MGDIHGKCKKNPNGTGKHDYRDTRVVKEGDFEYHFQKCKHCGKDYLAIIRVRRGKGGSKPGPRY